MPPKKSGADGSNTKTYSWTPEADLKLLYLMTIPRTLGAKEQAEIAELIGASQGAVRNRVTTIKAAHRKAYQEFGILMPGSAAVSKVASQGDSAPSTPAKKTTAAGKGRKRAAKDMDVEDDNDDDVFGVKKAKLDDDRVPSDDGLPDNDLGIKSEPIEDST